MKMLPIVVVLVCIFISILVGALPFLLFPAGALSLWVEFAMPIVSLFMLAATYTHLIPNLFSRTVEPGTVVVLRDRSIHQGGFAYLPWRELATISLSQIAISVDTSQGSSRLFTADRYPVNAQARAWLVIPNTDDAIFKAVENLPNPYTDAGRKETFSGILEDQLSECLRSVTLNNWNADVKAATNGLKDRLSAAVATFGHNVASMGHVEFYQVRTDQDTPTLEESGGKNAVAIVQAEQEEQAKVKIRDANKKRDVLKSNTKREIKLEQEKNKRLTLVSKQKTVLIKAAKAAAKHQKLHNETVRKDEQAAELARKKIEYEIAEESTKMQLEGAKAARLAVEQMRIEQENAFTRNQVVEDIKTETIRAMHDAERQFCLARIDHRLIEEAIKYRETILQQNQDFPGADLEIELRRQELDLRKELIHAQANVIAAAYEKTTTTVVADADAVARVGRGQLDGLAASAQVTQFVHSILNDDLIKSTATHALRTFLSARARGEGSNRAADRPEDPAHGVGDVDL